MSPISTSMVCHAGLRAGSAITSKTAAAGTSIRSVVERWLMRSPRAKIRARLVERCVPQPMLRRAGAGRHYGRFDIRTPTARAGSAWPAEDLPATGLGASNVVRRLVIHRRAADDMTVRHPEAGSVPWALD